MLAVINETRSSTSTMPTPTFWPTDPIKKPDVLDFVTKGISQNYLKAETVADLSSNHIPVFLRYSATVKFCSSKTRKGITSKNTDWNRYRRYLDDNPNMRTRLRTREDIDTSIERMAKMLQDAAKVSTPDTTERKKKDIDYPKSIKRIVGGMKKSTAKMAVHATPK